MESVGTPIVNEVEDKTGKKKVVYISIVVLVLLIIGASLVLFLSRKESPSAKRSGIFTKSAVTQPPQNSSQLPLIHSFEALKTTTTSPRLIYAEKNEVKSVDLITNKIVTLPIKLSSDAPFVSEILPSPTFRWVAYIDTRDGNIWIMDNQGNHKIKVSNQNLITQEGYYLADLNSGKVYLVPPLDNTQNYDIVGFIPKTNTLLYAYSEFIQSDDNNIVHLFALDVLSGVYNKVKTFDSFALQFSLFRDGKRVVSAEGNSGDSNPKEPTYSKISVSSINFEAAQLIASSSAWAGVHGPKVSPNGLFIAYMKRNSNSENDVIIYDLETHSEKNLGQVNYISYWYNDNKLVIAEGNGPNKVTLLDIQTGERKIITEDNGFNPSNLP